MVQDIQKYEKGFTMEAFSKYVEDIFRALVNSLSICDVSNLRPYLNEKIYNRFIELTSGYKKMKIKRVFEDFIVKDKRVQDYSIVNNTIVIKVLIITKFKDYFLNSNNEYVNKDVKLIEKGHYITFTKDLLNNTSKYIITDMDVI